MKLKTLEDFVGNTPLVKLQRIAGETNNIILVKLEGNNPAGSVKDRPAVSMIKHAEQRGDIKPGDTLIEATSGNTGIALAMAAAIKGYHLILIMPDNATDERKPVPQEAFPCQLAECFRFLGQTLGIGDRQLFGDGSGLLFLGVGTCWCLCGDMLWTPGR